MKLTSRQDIEAPQARVFAALADFEGWQRAASQRRAEVTRTDRLPAPAVGMSWQARFFARGRQRQVGLQLTQFDPPATSPNQPARLAASFDSSLFSGIGQFEVTALSSDRSRMSLVLEIKPKTLSARLLMQSARLARSRIERRFSNRVASFAEDLEQRLKAQG